MIFTYKSSISGCRKLYRNGVAFIMIQREADCTIEVVVVAVYVVDKIEMMCAISKHQCEIDIPQVAADEGGKGLCMEEENILYNNFSVKQ